MAEEIVPTPSVEQTPAPQESDLDRVASEVAKHRENPELAGASDQELVKQAIRTIGATAAPAPQQTATSDDSALPSYMSSAAPAAKLEVEDLVRMAFKDGIAKATSAAAKSNPFILDAFHDTLAGKLHDELKIRKLI